MKLNKILKNSLLVVFACLALNACATGNEDEEEANNCAILMKKLFQLQRILLSHLIMYTAIT